jgi:UDP-glucose 4-epimerase
VSTVAVTGGGGFIGRAVCRELHARGHRSQTFDLPYGDVRSLRSLGPGVDAVIHLAGVLGTHELFDAVHNAIDINVTGTANVLEAARRAGARYVGISMPAVFPSVYTATKLAAAGLERAYHHTYGLPVSRVRAFNAFGAGQKHGATHPQKILPTFAVEAWAGRPIPIWGDGEQTVDLVHVDDLARLLVDALGHGDDVTFDGGTGQAHTVNEVADMVLEITGSTAGVEHLPMRRGEIPTRIAATGDGWERLDWKPTFDLARFEETVAAYRGAR